MSWNVVPAFTGEVAGLKAQQGGQTGYWTLDPTTGGYVFTPQDTPNAVMQAQGFGVGTSTATESSSGMNLVPLVAVVAGAFLMLARRARSNPWRNYPGPKPHHALFGRHVGRFWIGGDPPAEVVEAREARRHHKHARGEWSSVVGEHATVEAAGEGSMERTRRWLEREFPHRPGTPPETVLADTNEVAALAHSTARFSQTPIQPAEQIMHAGPAGQKWTGALEAARSKRETGVSWLGAPPAEPERPGRMTHQEVERAYTAAQRAGQLDVALDRADWDVIKQNRQRETPKRGQELLDERREAQQKVLREADTDTLRGAWGELAKSYKFGAGERLQADINAELDRRKKPAPRRSRPGLRAEWRQQDNGGYRLSAGTAMFPTVAVTPIKVPKDPDWESKPSSLEASTSAAAFNSLVGWKTGGWHWSVVESGRRVGGGDVATLDEAQAAARRALPKRYANRLEAVA